MLEKLKQFISGKRILVSAEGYCPQVRTTWGWAYLCEDRTVLCNHEFYKFLSLEEAKARFDVLKTHTISV